MSTATLAAPGPSGTRRSVISEQSAQADVHLSAARFDKAVWPEGTRRRSPRLPDYCEESVSSRHSAPTTPGSRAERLPESARPAIGADPTLAASRARFGPRSAPLFYTALRERPGKLTWEAQPGAAAYRVVVGIPESEARIRPLLAATTGALSVPLAGVCLEPGTVYAWRVEPVALATPGSREAAADREEGDIPLAEAPGFWRQEGRFWRLEPDQAARWEHGCRLVSPMADPDFRNLGLALLLAEVGLYHEALLHIKNCPMAQAREARLTLAHTAQALIYKQMAQRMEAQRGAGANPETLPACFYAWAQAREQYHRQKVAARLGQEAAAGSAPQGLPRQAIPAHARRAA
ncbi:MAG TPA: hypothetical protein VFB21_17165 [Chthonomonadaceae bacterium]|nr:hypothetical protein [Chthonomonadaceae bacterium]